jgi:hypothetical protein
VETLRRELIVGELVVSELTVAKLIVAQIMGSELMTTAAHAVTSRSVCMHAASRKAVTTPPMTHATMGSKSMVPTASAMPATTTAPTVKSAASTPTAMPGDCRDVRHDAKRAHRDARRQNAYRSLLHGTFPTRTSKVVGAAARATTARISPHPTFNYRGGVTTSWPVTYTSEREGKKERTDESFIASAARPDTRRRAAISLHSDECRASRRGIGL